MDITEATYPVFEANQVLTNAHLNDLFEYLDEQNRLTRANLIGIGIVCGLDVEFNGTSTIRLSKGCGITSEGYLILEPADVDLVAVRPYTLPADYGYPPFVAPTTPPAQYPLWELLDDEDEPGAVLLTDALLDLGQKAMVLFLELRRDGLRNCAPNNCDDRGAQVTATVRRLLVDVGDLDKIVVAADSSGMYLGADLTERLNLPDLRMPRFDVRNTGPVETAQVLRAFQETFRMGKLAAATSAALTALYQAFQPLVADLFPADPFSTFLNRFGFLDFSPVTTGQVRFLQYYWDLFDDLLAGYDEVRWKGVDLLCACCPPAGLFPRHLMAGVLDPALHDNADYRHRFVRSPAAGECAERSRQVRQLFERLVAMQVVFQEGAPGTGIRATPSRWGDVPVSLKAIPYYYDQQGTPPLYELWDPVKTARRRANQNLSYRAGEYVPAPPAFVTDPLRYDLEPNGFLRIEGHLGLNVGSALKILLSLRKSYRLPIEVIALRTGAFDENAPVDLSKEECRFRDLEAMYDALKAELDCFLVKQAKYFYALPFPAVPGVPVAIDEVELVPTLALLKTRDPDFRAMPGTLGHKIESALTWRPGRPYPWIIPIPGGPDLPGQVYALVGVLSDLASLLTEDLRQLNLAAMAERYHRLVEIAAQIEEIRRSGAYNQPGLSDRLDDILFGCRLDPFEALVQEWTRRLRDAKQAQFLGHFLAAHPGVQHKAGVPLGGTFILVYTGPPQLLRTPGFLRNDLAFARPDVYSDTVAQLDDGTVIADFFLPYICGPDCATVQYQLPPDRFQVTTTTACTNGDGVAEVSVQATGASGSLSVRVDQGPFEPLSGPLLLAAGDHTLVVRDSTGAESVSVGVTVPPLLRIIDPQVQVNNAQTAWQVTFTIDGGLAPYSADSGTVVGQSYTSLALPVAEVLTVEIEDAAGCTASGQFESGVTPCDLPCDGQAIRAGYRFWLPEPLKGFPIKEYVVEEVTFVVTDASGNDHVFSADVKTVVGTPSQMGTADFLTAVKRWTTTINKLVAKEFGSDQWLTLAYESPSGTSTAGTLFVDRLECLGFVYQIRVSFVIDGRPYHYQLEYRASGTVIADLNTGGKAAIPIFTVSNSNKCRPNEDPIDWCKGTDLKAQIGRDGVDPDPIVLTARTSGADQPASWFWEIQDGIPSLAGGDKVTVRFQPVEPIEKTVRLTVFTEKGCVVTVDKVINIRKPGD
jgi:hypothetical protein